MTAIALASFKEALRKKLFLLVGLLTFVYLALLAIVVYFIHKSFVSSDTAVFNMFSTASGFMAVFGLYFSSMLVAFLSIMSSVGAVSSEIESGVVHSVITRPVSRSSYILGKFTGLAALLVIYSALLYWAVVLIFGLLKMPSPDTLGFLPLLQGMLFFVLQPVAILSLCVYGGVTFKTLSNGIFVIALYILGLIGGMLEQFGSLLKSDALYKWGIVSGLISPFDVIYRKMLSVIFVNIGITNPLFGSAFLYNTVPSPAMTVYFFVYTAALTALAVHKFRKKDI